METNPNTRMAEARAALVSAFSDSAAMTGNEPHFEATLGAYDRSRVALVESIAADIEQRMLEAGGSEDYVAGACSALARMVAALKATA